MFFSVFPLLKIQSKSYFQKAFELSYFGFYMSLCFTCACFSSTGKGEKSQLVPLKHSFSKDFQKLQIWFWNWPCTRPSNWDLVLSLSILKNNPHTPWSICNTLHCVLCICVYKYGKIHRKSPCGSVTDLMKFFHPKTLAVKFYNAISNGNSCSDVTHHGSVLYDTNINTRCYNVGFL